MKKRKNKKYGNVFTQQHIVGYLLDEVQYHPSQNLQDVQILEPAAGKGAFALEIIRRLHQSATHHHFSFSKAVEQNLCFIELDKVNFTILKNKIATLFSYLDVDCPVDSIPFCSQEDFLLKKFPQKFDCIVGNPPYVRHERIDKQKKALYRANFDSFRYRADLYIPFFEHALEQLKPDGLLSFICANRWLYNQYGQILRAIIGQRYQLKKLLNIEKASPFDEEVLAYPCISTIAYQQASKGQTAYYETDAKQIDFDRIVFRKVASPKDAAWENLFLDYDIDHPALSGLEAQGFEIGIGVATGADAIFIRKKAAFNGIESSRLLPIIAAKDIQGGQLNGQDKYVINPFENGKLCDLDQYPHLKAYLYSHKSTLEKRYIAKKTPHNWFKTIDRIKPKLLKKPKLLLPDLAGNKTLLIDIGQFYPHHSIYYITGKNLASLQILASLLMSDFIKKQLSQIGIRMNGGLPRFQTQVLKKIKLPIIANMTKAERAFLVKAYIEHDLEQVNGVVEKYCRAHQIG